MALNVTQMYVTIKMLNAILYGPLSNCDLLQINTDI